MAKAYYGIKTEVTHLDEPTLQNLCHLLFLNQSLSVKEVFELVKKLPEIPLPAIERLIDTLDQEWKLTESIGPIDGDDNENRENRLKSWIDLFDIGADDIELYASKHQLTDSIPGFIEYATLKRTKKPKEIQNLLSEYVIGQEHAKKVLSCAIYIHLLRIGKIRPEIAQLFTDKSFDTVPVLPNPNIMIIGSTGTGKSYTLKVMAKLFNLPLLRIDCSSLVSSGYYGNGLNDYLYNFFSEYSCNQDYIDSSIIFFDEFDKLSEVSSGVQGSVKGISMQQEFLNPLEDRNYMVYAPKGSNGEGFTINLGNCMFVFGGSFFGIEKIVRKRFGASRKIGFNLIEDGNIPSANTILNQITTDDLVTFGILPELVGRINHIVTLSPHSRETIIDIMKKSHDSVYKAYENYFEFHADKLIVEDEVFGLIADKVLEKNTGARAINNVLNHLLKEYMYDSPNLKEEKIIIDKKYFLKVFGG